MAETVKLSEMGSRAELNIANKSNFQDWLEILLYSFIT